MRILPGHPYPLGAGWDGEGVNFALFSEKATAVELCLFDQSDQMKESHRIRIEERTDQVWHATYRKFDLVKCTGTGSMAPMTPLPDTGSTRQSC